MPNFVIPIIVIAVLLIMIGTLISCIVIVPQAHVFIVERLGVYAGTWNPGLHIKTE